MSDNLRQYRARRAALTQGYPGEPQGQRARHLTTLAALSSGIVASKRTQLPHIAAKVPDGAQAESRVKRFARWVDNDTITAEVYGLPYAAVLLAHLAWQRLVLVIDGSAGGRGWVAVMMPVVQKGRALPLAWLVRAGQKGHCPANFPSALGEQVQEGIPLGASGGLLGDGAFDGTALQHTREAAGWSYVCRTGCHVTASWDGATFRLDTVGWCIKPGTLAACPAAAMTREAYGPILLLCCWATGYQEPVYLVSHMDTAAEACRL